MKTCYMCDKVAISHEHVPPRCIFPQQKDMPQAPDYRKNLITVPSCADHNLRNSKNDEYLMAVIALHWQNNQVAYKHAITKVKRAFQHSKRYWDLFFGEGKHHSVTLDGQGLITAPVDIDRFDAEMEKIVRGIYFYHFQQKCREEILFVSRSLVALGVVENRALKILAEANKFSQLLFAVERKYGANPDIFYYQILQSNEPTSLVCSSGIAVPTVKTSTIMRLVFYGGFEVIAAIKTTS